MKQQEYLNYTRGTMLQTLCEEAETNVAGVIRWIKLEQRKLLKNQTNRWGITVSDGCYYRYLSILQTELQKEDHEESLKELLEEIEALTRKKIYVLFLTQEISCWPSLESVFMAAEQDPDYETALVYTPFFHLNFGEQTDCFDEYKAMGVPVIRHSEYDLIGQSPDLVFIIKPYGNVPERYEFKNIEKVIPRAVYIPYGMEITTDLIKYGFQYYLHYKAWRHCAYGEVVKEYGKRYGYRNGENIAVWGHPKADHYQDMDEKRSRIPAEWKQIIGGRKTILWTPHHLIDLGDQGTGTWLLWGEKILDLAINTPDIVFIVRPHPLMMGALVNNGVMSESQVKKLQERMEQAENIIFDTSALYYNAFYAADAIITDGTTFCVEFLYTKKPILLTPRNMQGFYLYHEMQKSYYIAQDMKDIAAYIKMVQEGEDPLCEKRLQLYQRMFFLPEDGTVGENIMKQVKHDVQVECSAKICSTPIVEYTEVPEKPEEYEDENKDRDFPLFSILVLCYKNTNLLYGMLDSIFRQDYPRIQLIVSDDGSADFEEEQIEKYIDTHRCQNIEDVIIRKNKKNLGTVRHIYEALSLVKGEYFVFTAADDRFYGNDIISQYILRFLKNPNAAWLVAKCRLVTADYKRNLSELPARVDDPYFEEGDPIKLFSRWSRRGMAIPCCMAFRADALNLVGGIDLSYCYLEDWPLVLKLLRSGYAPIYYSRVVALHSVGGVTNSNDRYGKGIRKAFYNDKYLIFKKEVTPYSYLQLPEDRKAYKQYLREIMARNYFLNVDWPETTLGERIALLIKKPRRILWALEVGYGKYKKYFERKKMFVLSQVLLLFSLLFFSVDIEGMLKIVFKGIGCLDFTAGLVLLLASLVTYPMEKYFNYKSDLRKKLVN